MSSIIRAIPVFPKIVLGSLLLLVLVALSHRGHSQSTPNNNWSAEEQTDYRPQAQRASERSGVDEAELSRQYLAQFQAQQSKVQAQMRDCTVQMQQTSNQWYTTAASGSGQMPGGTPLCEQYMPQLIAQESYLEGVIYQLQTGDTHATLEQITGVQVGGSSGGSYYRPSTPENDGGISAVENYDRESMRGNNLYTDEAGDVHERALTPNLYRNRVTGEFVPRDQPYAPNDGRDYEQLTPQN